MRPTTSRRLHGDVVVSFEVNDKANQQAFHARVCTMLR